MELLKCAQCGSTDMELQGYMVICRHCGSKYLLSGQGPEASLKGKHYIERAKEAHLTGSKKFVSYTEKAIKYAPEDPEAWLYRMYALAEDRDAVRYADVLAELTTKAGDNVLLFSDTDHLAEYKRAVYYWYLSFAIAIANNKQYLKIGNNRMALECWLAHLPEDDLTEEEKQRRKIVCNGLREAKAIQEELMQKRISKNKLRDKFRGCLVGGAAGDALGYTVEFWGEKKIFADFGENGITQYRLIAGKAIISDDTQMTLFTANALMTEAVRGVKDGMESLRYISYLPQCYEEWLLTQTEKYPIELNKYEHISWLLKIPEMYAKRAPGNTCLAAIRDGCRGRMDSPINTSKGCGGVMRVAPIGLFFPKDRQTDVEPDILGAEAAALTHGHEMGYIPAAMLVHVIRELTYTDCSIKEAVESAKTACRKLFPEAGSMPGFLKLIDRAVALADQNADDLEAIHKLGEGWTGDEALAIAVFCALKYPDDMEKALTAAVNHKGDSDSTGSIAGNIVGAHIGYEKIPRKYKEGMELEKEIRTMAEDLFEVTRIDELSFIRGRELGNKYWSV